MKRLRGRVALITGAGAGIGRGIARRFAAEGASLVLTEYNAATGAQVAEEVRREFGVAAEFVHADVSRRADVGKMVQSALDRFGRVDILVNNAWSRRQGGFGAARVEKQLDEDLDHAWRMGAMSALWAMQAVFPPMRDRRWGRIVNLCSLNGVNAHPFTVDYNMAKEALRTLTRTAAREWAPYQICCNVICPGAATEAYRQFAEANPENAAALLKLNPMGRMGDPESDIGSVALFLASEDCRYLTGNTLFVDGGSHINGVPWSPQLPES